MVHVPHSVGNGYLTYAPWKYVTSLLKPDIMGKMQSVWIWEVFDGTNSREECPVYLDKPGQIPSGSSSFRCVGVPGYTWPLTTLQYQTINQSNIHVEEDV